MKNMIIQKWLFATLCTVFIMSASPAWAQDMKKGAFILISTEGKVNFVDAQGQQVDPVAVGKPIPSSYQVETGEGGKLVGLLSNGTLLTLVEKTKMKIGTFEQQPFEAGDKKLADLTGEPSKSNVSVDLDFGALVVKTKKLNKGSVFNINSPVGVAGIRGTEFQMASNPGQGVQLDVTESTVAFAPPGGGAPVEVSQGGGLSVSSSGVATPRAVNPSVAQSIQTTNQAATEATNDVSLGEVTAAMEQVSAESESSEEQSGEESSEDSEEESAEESSEDSDSGDADEGSSETDAMEDQQASSGSEAGDAAPEVAAPLQVETNIDALLETNADAKQTRKTGEVGASAEDISSLGLDADQMEFFFSLPVSLQNSLKSESPAIVRRLIDLSELTLENMETYFSYSADTRKKVVLLDDSMLVSLLDKEYDEEMLDSLLTEENLTESKSSKTPTIEPDDQRITELGDKLRDSGNGALFEEISELNNGEWTDEWIETAEIANRLTQDYDLSNSQVWSEWENLGGIDGGDALENPFFEEVSATYGELDKLSFGLVEDHLTIGGNTITIGAGTYDLGDFLENNDDLLIAGSESLNLSGKIQFETDNPDNTRVVAMSGGSITASEGLELNSAISDLVLSAREDVLLKGATVSALNNLYMQSLRDLTIQNSTLEASQLIRIQAARDLIVDDLAINNDLPSLIMEATTLRLSNINFPGSTQVTLNSLKGPLDGKYPNFGSVELGRVNFIKDVKSGGAPLSNRDEFNTNGQNITIGKISNP